MSTAGVRFPAIGTTAHLVVTEPAALAEAEILLRDFLADLDLACSRFRDDSALSMLNSACASSVAKRQRARMSTVDSMLVAALRVALRAAEETDGLVDPTLGGCMIAIGYDRSFADVPATSSRPVTPVCAGQAWREISIDEVSGVISLPVGVRLDLGATGKAWAADVAAQQIAERLDCGVLVNLGGDLAVAGQAPERGWTVRVTADHAVSAGGQKVSLRAGGLATSSTTVRTWRRADEVLHHVLDPGTGRPARRVWRYVSVAAASCVDANTAATAALVLGRRAPDWLTERDLAARLVATDGTVTAVAGWPSEPAPSTVEVVA